MNGRWMVACALMRRVAVTALASSTVLVVATPEAHIARAYNGGTSYLTPADQPCVAPCLFRGDNTGPGLSAFPYDGSDNVSATWWAFTPPTTTTYTFRATSISPAGWNNTLTLTAADGTVVAFGDDSYGLDSMITAGLTAGTSYRVALSGRSAGNTGTADITISADLPAAPTTVRGTEGDGTVALTWTAPADHLAAITAYLVYVNGGSDPIAVPGTPPPTGTTITGLTNGTPYTFRVSAVNGNGTGPKSAASAEYAPYGPTSTSLAFSPASPTFGAPFDVVVTVTGSSTVTSGSVTLYRGGTSLGSHVVSNGTARWTETDRPLGSPSYRAEFAGNGAWFASSGGPTSVTIGQGVSVITFVQPDDTALSVGSFTVAPTSSASLAVTLASTTTSVCTVSGFTVTLRLGGRCTLTASQTGDENWLAATDVVRSFEVTDAPQTITFDPPTDRPWSATTFDVAPSADSGLVVTVSSDTDDVCTVNGFTVTLVTGGICTLTAAQTGNRNFASATDVVRSFKVTDAPQTITFDPPTDRPWSATTFDVAPSANSGLAIALTSDTDDVCTASGFTVTMERAGTCTLTAAQAGNGHFVAASRQQSFEITSATQATFTAGASTYELTIGQATDLTTEGGSGTGSVTHQVTSGADRCSITGTRLTATAAGTCIVTATKASDTRFAVATDATPLITVARATPTITISGTADVQTGGTAAVVVTVTGLLATHAPGTVSVQLTGAVGGAGVAPNSTELSMAADGMSGTATFVITVGEVGALSVNARLAGSAAYQQVDTPVGAVLTVHSPPAALVPVVPSRIIDTRPDHPHVRPAPDRVLAAGEVLEVQFTDLPGLVPPAGVNAVALHIGVVAPDGDGYVTAYPCGVRPVVSNLNFRSGQTVSNAAVVPIDDVTGSVCFYPSRATHLIVDVTGWFAAGLGFVDAPPSRVVDTRAGHDALRPVTEPFTAGQVREVTVVDLPGVVPAQGVAAVSLNLTVVQPVAAGYVTAYPCGERPNASSVNFTAGRTVANLAIVPVSAAGTVCFYASQSLHLVVDVNGWFRVGQGFDGVGPVRVFDTRPGYSGLRTVPSARVEGEQVLRVQITDLATFVPAGGVGAVSLNVTVVDPAGDGFITVWACGDRPGTSSLNYAAHRTTAGAVIAPVDPTTGNVCFSASRSLHLVVDVNGWFNGNVG